MSEKTEQEELILRYFFGETDEDEANRIEQQILTDSQFFERMLLIEGALIDDYVRGRLPEPERSKAEAFLLSSDRQKLEVSFVEDLIKDLAKTKPANTNDASLLRIESSSRWRSLLAWLGIQDSGKRFSFALLLLPLVLGLCLAIWNLTLQNKLSQIEAKQAALEKRNQELEQGLALQANSSDKVGQQIEDVRSKTNQIEHEVATLHESRPTTSSTGTAILALEMESIIRGGGELKVVRIRPGINWLEIRINVGEDEFKSYDAIIKTFDDRLIWNKTELKPARANPGRIVLTLPAKLFVSQDYTLKLKGVTPNDDVVEIGDYHFRVKE